MAAKVKITFDSNPSYVNVNKSFFKYDKDFAFSLGIDDGLLDAYRVGLPILKGGNVIHNDGIDSNYPGLYYTDGCGNDISFSANLNINSSFIQDSETAYMSKSMVRECSARGMFISNHGNSARTQFETPFWSEDEATRNQEVTDEIKQGSFGLKDTLQGVKVDNFVPPSNDATYEDVLIQMVNSGYLNFASNLNNPTREAGHTGSRDAEYWLANINTPKFLSRDFNTWTTSNVTRTASDFDWIDAKNTAVGLNHAWFTIGIHNVGLGEADSPTGNQWRYLDFKHLMEGLESRYGKGGSDNMWMASTWEVYEYLLCRRDSQIISTINGNQCEIILNFRNVNDSFKNHDLSLLIDSDANISLIEYEDIDGHSDIVNYKSQGNTHALINTFRRGSYESLALNRNNCTHRVEKFESTMTQADKDSANAAMLDLSNGDYKNSLQARIDAVTVVPDAKIIQVDFGRSISGYTMSFPWNDFGTPSVGHTAGSKLTGLSATDSSLTGLDLEVTASFDNYDSNTVAVDEVYPFEATRDCFKTPDGATSTLQLQNCDAGKTYDFKFYATRGFVGTSTNFEIDGTTVNLNHKGVGNNGNVLDTVEILNISPDGSGNIDINVSGTGTLNVIGFINVLEITER